MDEQPRFAVARDLKTHARKRELLSEKPGVPGSIPGLGTLGFEYEKRLFGWRVWVVIGPCTPACTPTSIKPHLEFTSSGHVAILATHCDRSPVTGSGRPESNAGHDDHRPHGGVRRPDLPVSPQRSRRTGRGRRGRQDGGRSGPSRRQSLTSRNRPIEYCRRRRHVRGRRCYRTGRMLSESTRYDDLLPRAWPASRKRDPASCQRGLGLRTVRESSPSAAACPCGGTESSRWTEVPSLRTTRRESRRVPRRERRNRNSGSLQTSFDGCGILPLTAARCGRAVQRTACRTTAWRWTGLSAPKQ